MHGSVDFPLSARTLGPLALFFLAHFLGSAGITLVLATAPAIEHALGIGHAGFGLMLAAYYGTLFVCSLPAGWMVDRFGLRTMLFAAQILLAVGMAIFSGAHGLPLAALGLAFCGAGYACVNPATARGVLASFPPGGRATAMGLKQTGVPAGGVLAALLAASGVADWRQLAIGTAVIVGAAGFALLAWRGAHASAPLPARLRDIKALLRVPRLASFNAGTAAFAIAQSAFFAYLVLYARDMLAVSAAVASTCLAIAHVASATGRIGWGVLSDRFVRNGRTSCLVMIGIAGSVGICLLLWPQAAGTTAGLVFASALIGFTLGGFAGLNQTAVVEMVERRNAGAAIGYNMLLVNFGTLVGPVAFGAGVEATGYPAAWSVVAGMMLCGAALFRASARRAVK